MRDERTNGRTNLCIELRYAQLKLIFQKKICKAPIHWKMINQAGSPVTTMHCGCWRTVAADGCGVTDKVRQLQLAEVHHTPVWDATVSPAQLSPRPPTPTILHPTTLPFHQANTPTLIILPLPNKPIPTIRRSAFFDLARLRTSFLVLEFNLMI